MPAYCPGKTTEEENATAQMTNTHTKKTAFVQIGSEEREKPQRLFVSQWVVMEGWRVVGKARWGGSQPTWHAFSTSPQSSVFSTNGLKQILWSCALQLLLICSLKNLFPFPLKIRLSRLKRISVPRFWWENIISDTFTSLFGTKR